jgi:hypothetical protein
MSGIVFFIMAIIFIALISKAKENPSKANGPMRNARPRNFITYFDTLPDASQIGFMDHLDEVQRLQMLEMLEHRDENVDVPQDLIDNFNDWTQSEEDKSITMYDSSSFDNFDSSSYDSSDFRDYNSGDSSSYDDSNSSDSSSWSDSYSGDSSSYSDSSSSWSDSSSDSFSDSGSSDCGGSGSDF